MSTAPNRSLSGYRILDLSRILAGPHCTMMLGEQGADVIKVERPGVGDDTRGWGPPFALDQKGQPSESAYYLSCNRNKRSITINLKSSQGRALVRELAMESDVLVHNFTPGLMHDFGLGYDDLHAEHPGLIYASISAYGQDGPYHDRPGYDMVLSAVGGLMHITGEPDGPPCKVGVAITDVLTGVHAAGAITTALLHRERFGVGQHIDISLLDVQVSALANIASNHLIAGVEASRLGTAHASIVPYQVFPTADRPIAIAAANQKLWHKLSSAMGHGEWQQDPKFATNVDRVANREELVAKLNAALITKTCDEWQKTLIAAGVPCGPVNDMQHLFQDPQVTHRDMVASVAHPTLGELPLVGIPIKYSASPGQIDRHPPLLGEHTREVLAEVLGYTEERIETLIMQDAL
jgi:crotonobetainyl-CoA:carnitine CoA-transferase CaiB-like acyl-CoA transferase